MGIRTHMRVVGVQRVARKLRQVATAFGVDDRKMEKIMKGITDRYRESARAKVPIGKTGRMKEAISSVGRSEVDEYWFYKIRKETQRNRPMSLFAMDYRKSRLGHLHEWGTVKMGAHPYFRPAIDENLTWTKDHIKRATKKIIARAALR